MFMRDNPELNSLKQLIENKEQELESGEDEVLKKAVLKDISRS